MKKSNKYNSIVLREMVITDFKVRYQGSALGYLWSLLKPLFLFAILYVVFTKFFKFGSGIPHYPVYLFLGIVMWSFFAEATANGMGSIVGRGDLIRKISLPRHLIVISGTFSALINLLLNMVVVFVFAFINGLEPRLTWLLLPIMLVELFIIAQAFAFFLAAFYVKFRDASYIWEVVMQALFYATPIIYPLSFVAEKYHKFLLLNPIAQTIQDARYVFVSNDTITAWKVLAFPYIVIPFVLIAIMLVIARAYFIKESKYFAENI